MDKPVFTTTCVVGEEEALRLLLNGGTVTISSPNPDVRASATIRGIGNDHGSPLSYEVTLHVPIGDLTVNDAISHMDAEGVIEWLRTRLCP